MSGVSAVPGGMEGFEYVQAQKTRHGMMSPETGVDEQFSQKLREIMKSLDYALKK
ncbi:MAG: hypothetical protein ACK4IX_06455 [Candidatus Sericytochromatia bacterium]